MKKILLGGTALVVAAAAAAMPASAAEVTSGLKLKISGFVAFETGLIVDSSDHNSFDRDYDMNSNGRLQFDISNTTDSGLEYGARIRMNNANRRNNVTVDRQYVYLKGSFGTITLGDAPPAAGDFGYFFAPDDILNSAGGYGDNLDGNYRYGGGSFFMLDPTYNTGLDKSTGIKYSSPSFGGFIFAAQFIPVISTNKDLSNGTQGRKDLFNDGQLYENVINGGIGYEGEFGGTSVKVRGSAAYGHGVDGHYDLEAYSFGGSFASGGITGSVNWVGVQSGFAQGTTDRNVNTISAGLGYTWEAFNFGLGYAYTWAEKNNGLSGESSTGVDLKDNHVAALTVNYTLAPGLNTYGEVVYEIQNFRFGGGADGTKKTDWSQTTFLTGISVAF